MVDYFSAMLDARRRERWLLVAIAVVGGFLGLAGVPAIRMPAQPPLSLARLSYVLLSRRRPSSVSVELVIGSPACRPSFLLTL